MDPPRLEGCRVNLAERDGGVLLLTLTGEFDELSSSRLVAVAETIAQRVPSRVRIDAADVTFASSAMLGALIRLHRVTTGVGGTIGFEVVSASLARVLEVTDLAPMFDAPTSAVAVDDEA